LAHSSRLSPPCAALPHATKRRRRRRRPWWWLRHFDSRLVSCVPADLLDLFAASPPIESFVSARSASNSYVGEEYCLLLPVVIQLSTAAAATLW
jgi:hypothetical protein